MKAGRVSFVHGVPSLDNSRDMVTWLVEWLLYLLSVLLFERDDNEVTW